MTNDKPTDKPTLDPNDKQPSDMEALAELLGLPLQPWQRQVFRGIAAGIKAQVAEPVVADVPYGSTVGRPHWAEVPVAEFKPSRTVPVFTTMPTSCRCGGDLAWVIERDGLVLMLGCVCHHDPFDVVRKALERGR